MSKIVGKECRFVLPIRKTSFDQDDLHLVKEVIHYEDGRTEPRVTFIKDYQRPYWVTKKGLRNHKAKKTTELIENVDEFTSTQSDLAFNVARSISEPWLGKQGLRAVAQSPYVYGLDQDASVYIKKQYDDKYKEFNTFYTVAGLDIETDVVDMTEEAIMCTVAFKNKVFTVVRADFVKNISSVTQRVESLTNDYLSEYVNSLSLECETIIVDTEIDIWIESFKKLHEWKPDFVTIWNIDFEMNKFLEACERANVDPASITSDPSVPKNRRHFRYKPGPTKKVTASGKVIPINTANRWNTVYTPASFYLIDGMCVYRQLRLAKQEKQSYSLDSILNDELKLSKLKFKEADHIPSNTLPWHTYLQKNYKLEYIVYNRFDVIAMLLLDEKIMDLKLAFPKAAGYSNYDRFSSQPYKVCVRYNYYLLEKGYVLGSTGSEMQGEFDDEILGLDDWIITLKAHLQQPGLPLLDEYLTDTVNISENYRLSSSANTGLYMYVSDIDIIGAYPSAEIMANSSVETTKCELISVEGIHESVFRRQNMNIASFPVVNTLDYCTTMHNFPSLDKWLAFYDTKS